MNGLEWILDKERLELLGFREKDRGVFVSDLACGVTVEYKPIRSTGKYKFKRFYVKGRETQAITYEELRKGVKK